MFSMATLCLTLCLVACVVVAAVGKELTTGNYRPPKASPPMYKPLDVSTISADGMLTDWSIVASPTLDRRGQHYYFLSTEADLVSGAMAKGKWERTLNEMFKDLWDNRDPSEKHSIVVDVGVNFGCFFLFAASLGCHVYGFEMQPKLYTVVEIGIRLSGYKHHAQLTNAAVWYKEDVEMSFTPVVYGPKQSNLGYTKLRGSSEGTVKINTSRIDSMLVNRGNIFFLKLDVEEAEPMALLGMNSIITAQRITHFVVELKSPDILEVFYELGYSCRMFDASRACAWPNIHSSCNMPTWESMLEYFRLHPADAIKKKYYDIHCTVDREKVKEADIQGLIKRERGKLANTPFIRYNGDVFAVVRKENERTVAYVRPVQSSEVTNKEFILDVPFKTMMMMPMRTYGF